MSLSDIFRSVAAEMEVGLVEAEFYPYRELKHTWCRRGHSLRFRVSDYLESAPDLVLRSLAAYLICQANNMPCSAHISEPYLQYCKSGEPWRSEKMRYLSRFRNLRLGPRGSVRDLKEVFHYVNTSYFGGGLPEPDFAWTNESATRRLGFYSAPLNLLAVNSCLDSESVPRYVLEFIVYHELLHHKQAGTGRPIKRVHHTREFKEQEMIFTSYAEAEQWLRRLASGKKKRRNEQGVPRV